MHAEIITIGDELLLGQTVDTNSAWMGQALMEIGVRVHRITSISDEPAEIVRALDEATGRVQLVLVTGGLGPTRDDRTKSTLADYFETKLVLNEAVLAQITAWFAGRGLPMLQVNRDQAMLPVDCTVLMNPRGTAMGMWFEKASNASGEGPCVVVSMPGVPYEMKGLMREEVLPRIQKQWKLPLRYQRTILTQGVGESFLSAQVAEWEQGLEAKGVAIAYLPAPGQVRVRLSAESSHSDKARWRVDAEADEFCRLASNHVVTDRDESLAQAVVRVLTASGLTLATAESCTGGSIAASLTAVPGASAVFLGSIVAYSNAVKSSQLGVLNEHFNTVGAVSEAVVREMAEGARNRTGADVAVATSGIAGPGGGTPEKPVGTIWIALSTQSGTEARRLQLGTNRSRNVDRTVLECLAWVFRTVKNGQ